MNTPVPARGEIWVVNFNPGRGSEQRGIRPAVILQNDVGNRYAATTIVAAITTTLKPYPVTVALGKGEGGLNKPSMVNLAQILTVDKSRLDQRLGSLSPERMEAVDRAALVSLGVEL
jgi:mRNA interferase MazF